MILSVDKNNSIFFLLNALVKTVKIIKMFIITCKNILINNSMIQIMKKTEPSLDPKTYLS